MEASLVSSTLLAWIADPAVSPKSRHFISFLCLFEPYFCVLFSFSSLRKVPVLATVAKIWCLTSILVFPFLPGIFLCCTKTSNPLWEPSAASFRARRKKDGAMSTSISQYPLGAVVTSISVAPVGATGHTLRKRCRGHVSEKEANPPSRYNSVLLC